MSELSRRNFVSIGAVAVGAAAVAGVASQATAQAEPAHAGKAQTSLASPLVARVRDLASGEVELFIGTREVVVHDKVLAQHLAAAAATA